MRTGLVGRLLRLALGLLLLRVVFPFWLTGSAEFRISALALLVALTLVYSGIAWSARRRPPARHPFLAATAVLVPLIALYILGSGGGPLFGAGEGQLAALTYLGLSFLVVAARADRGCEVLALPQLGSRSQARVPCLLFHLPDRLEDRLSGRSRLSA